MAISPVTATEPFLAEAVSAWPNTGDEVIPDGATKTSSARFRTTLVSGALYLVLALLLWWHVWTGHPTSTTTCGCGDSSLFTWFLAWPAYAIRHGLNPLYSTAVFHPTGVNLLSNTAEVGFGIVLAPVTWLFGPIASLNVALTASPALSGLAMFVLLRRWTTWAPAAFVGGLFYGFSPFFIVSLTDAHLMIGAAFIPPLIVACLDEILVRQRWRPVGAGVALALLVVIQFFIGTEALVIVAFGCGSGVVLLVLYGLLRHPDVVRARFEYATVALWSAAMLGGSLLAYPVWFALSGPAHISGNIWDNALLSFGGTNLHDYFLPGTASPTVTSMAHRWGGYQGVPQSFQYFGLGMAAVIAAGVTVWRRDRRLWLLGIVGLFAVLLSFGIGIGGWSLWRVFVRFPMMDNVVPSRFLLVIYLAVAAMFGIIVDNVHASVLRKSDDRGSLSTVSHLVSRRIAAAVCAAVVVIALAPIAIYFSTGLPLTTASVVLPQWFRTVGPTLSEHQVVLAFPAPFELTDSAMTWQAVDGMSYSMVGGGGPNSILKRAGKERAGQAILGDYSISSGVSIPTLPEVRAVRIALHGWGVTTLVLPDPGHLPRYERVSHVRSLVVLLTAVTGIRPSWQAGAWVWTGVNRAGRPVPSSDSALALCTVGPPVGTVTSLNRASACVLHPPEVTPRSATQ
jgi:hypothetical protein